MVLDSIAKSSSLCRFPIQASLPSMKMLLSTKPALPSHLLVLSQHTRGQKLDGHLWTRELSRSLDQRMKFGGGKHALPALRKISMLTAFQTCQQANDTRCKNFSHHIHLSVISHFPAASKRRLCLIRGHIPYTFQLVSHFSLTQISTASSHSLSLSSRHP